MTKFAIAAFAAAIATGSFIACSGEQGPAGPQGEQGLPGAQGPKGDPGVVPDTGVFTPPDASIEAGGSCTSPCHGFGNVVDQWKFSKHFIMNEMSDEEPVWTSAGNACGNCHAIDSIERRLAGNVTIADGGVGPVDVPKGHLNYRNGAQVTEVLYSGAGKTAVVHCTTCHDYKPTNDPHNTGGYVPGQAPLRVSSTADFATLIEKSPAGSTDPVGQAVGNWKAGNTCVMCHKSRKDVTLFITASNKLNNAYWGPHEGPQTDIYSGKGGYHFAGMTYGTSVHTTLANGCTSCHMQPVKDNKDVPDHSMHPKVDFCKTCHTTYTGTSFDVQSGQSNTKKALAELESLLNAKGFLTRSAAKPYAALSDADMAGGAFELDKVRPGSGVDGDSGASVDQVVDAPTAGALYNYLLIARSKDFGVHNPTYTKQLLWDSIKAIKGSNPSSLSSRPD